VRESPDKPGGGQTGRLLGALDLGSAEKRGEKKRTSKDIYLQDSITSQALKRLGDSSGGDKGDPRGVVLVCWEAEEGRDFPTRTNGGGGCLSRSIERGMGGGGRK